MIVIVTQHAAERALERYPSVLQDAHAVMPYVRGAVTADVSEALKAKRVACQCPRFAVSERFERRRAGQPGEGHLRHVWTADESRCYVVVRRAGVWVVITALATREAVAA